MEQSRTLNSCIYYNLVDNGINGTVLIGTLKFKVIACAVMHTTSFFKKLLSWIWAHHQTCIENSTT